MSEIAVLIPVLARPHQAARVLDSLHNASETDVQAIFICSPEDGEQIDACHATEAELIVTGWKAGPGDFARKHNLGYQLTDTPYLFLGADDLDFQPGWDTHALNEARRTHAGVIGTDDDANPLVRKGKHSTHPLVARRYIDEVGGTWHDGPGIVYHEGYDHQYVDNELCLAAMDRGEWAFARQSIVRHLHPMYPARGEARTPMDATYTKAMAEGAADGIIFRERQARAHPRRSRRRTIVRP